MDRKKKNKGKGGRGEIGRGQWVRTNTNRNYFFRLFILIISSYKCRFRDFQPGLLLLVFTGVIIKVFHVDYKYLQALRPQRWGRIIHVPLFL